MYIYLDDSLETLDFNNSDNLINLGYLLDGFYKGYFVLSGKRDLLKRLSKCTDLSRPARESALIAYKNYAMNQSFYNTIPYKIIITSQTTDINNSKGKWIIDISKVQPGFLSRGILILAENLSDSEFLNYAAEHYLIQSKYSSILKISNHFQGGGGTTITGELENQLKKMQEFIFCFKDSDKLSPLCNLSENATKCQNLINTNIWISFFSHTHCREAENLIPRSLLDQTPNIPYENLRFLRDLEQESKISFYPYIDLKLGLTKKFYNNLGENTPKYLFWTNLINFLKEKNIIKDCKVDEKENCEIHTQHSGKNCVLLETSNANTLDHVINFLKLQSHHKSFEIIKNDSTNKEWLDIGETVFWLSCALSKVRLS